MNIQKARRDQRARSIAGRWRPLADQFHRQAALFESFTKSGGLRILVQFDVPAQRQPAIELAMMDQEHLSCRTTKIATVKSIFSWMWAI